MRSVTKRLTRQEVSLSYHDWGSLQHSQANVFIGIPFYLDRLTDSNQMPRFHLDVWDSLVLRARGWFKP